MTTDRLFDPSSPPLRDFLGYTVSEWPTEHVRVREATIQEAFDRFDHENPQVYQELLTLAIRWKLAGHSRCGIGMLFEVLRWYAGLRTGGDDFKLNNNYRSRYVRKLIREDPDFEDFFELRMLHAR